MSTYKLKFTKLQNEIFRLLCVDVGKKLNQREIAENIGVSAVAVSKALPLMVDKDLVLAERDKRINLVLVELNLDNDFAIKMKRVENLKMIYESGLVGFLEERFPGSVVILFGSYAFGEDSVKSDIDIAIIGCKEKLIHLKKFDEFLQREIRINFYDSFENIDKYLSSNLFNGIVLGGRIKL